jgi:DNA-directed RNA polymerase subunit beta'
MEEDDPGQASYAERAPNSTVWAFQAFEPVLIEGSAIQLHPLVTTAFNADFDGDQMRYTCPFLRRRFGKRVTCCCHRELAETGRWRTNNSPSKDMVLGVYYLTMNG